jgi:hypothetical protein
MKKLLLFLVFLGFIQVSYACTCYNFYKTPMFDRFNALTEIFEGTVLKREYNTVTNLTDYYFKVEKAYKGVGDDKVIVISTPTSCGQYFDSNTLWLVYAKDRLTNRCALNTNLDQKENPTPNKNNIRHKVIQNLNILRNTKETEQIVETNKKGDTVATGRVNNIKQPIGYWKYTNTKKNECTITQTVCYDDYGCVLEDHSVKSCN